MIDSIKLHSASIAGRETVYEPKPHPGAAPPPTAAVRDRVTISNPVKGVSDDSRSLSPEEQQKVNELKQRDAEVKAHEQAHMAAGGGVVQGGASYQYERGPDGRMYAVGGKVKIDVSSERTPEATIRKMQQVRRAALAPAQPSGTDRAVAAQAAEVENQARSERSREIASQAQSDNPYLPSMPSGRGLGGRIDLKA